MTTHRLSQPQRVIAWLTTLSLASPFYPAYAATPTPLAVSQIPLFISTTSNPNILLILDNSNSMDEAASGTAVGSDNPNSKSEIARGVAKTLVSTYMGKMNLGLMAYQQQNVSLGHLHNSLYDASFNPQNENPNWTGTRASSNKKYKITNPSDPTRFIYYNVALPFYSSYNQGTAFCYSNTANAGPNNAHPDGFWDINDDPTNGPWDNYVCFSSKTGTSDTLPAANRSNASTYGWNGYLYQSSFFPTDSDIAQSIYDFGRFMTWSYVGRTWNSNSSPGRGYLHTPIKNLDSTQAAKLNVKLATSQFSTNKPTDANYPLQNAGLTPIEGTLLTARDYFSGSWNNTAEGYTASCYPLPESCKKNFVVLITDGLPSTDKNGNPITSTSTALNAATAAAAALKAAGVNTYVVGFALPYGTNPNQLDSIAVAGGTNQAYSANDQTSLNNALSTIFSDIATQSGAAGAVATNSSSLNANSAIYQAKFDPRDWSGQLLAYNIGSTGNFSNSALWDAATKLPPHTARQIITYKPSIRRGIPFAWPSNSSAPTSNELDSDQINSLGNANVLEYIRGNSANEGTSSPAYRRRPTSRLGDIINSAPVYVGKPASGYGNTIEAGATYSTFVNDKSSRTPILYVGANDGMLHAFRASDGVEIFSYIPSTVYSNLSQLTQQTYNHRYFVDGSPSVADVFFGGSWRTVLVGGLNAGGQGIYALDITNPGTLSQANSNALVLWEFTDRDTDSSSNTNSNFDADLGLTFSQPQIGKMQNGSWVAIFGNGYNNTTSDGSASTTGNAVLYIVDIQTGQLIKKIDTKTGMTSSPNGTTPNGLSTPAIVDIDGDEIIDYIYAGDLQGNLWKFDVTSTNTSNWQIAYDNNASPNPLFSARIGSTQQPITTRPEVGNHPQGGYFVYFGTGKYFETGDNSTSGAGTQTFYGIWDTGSAIGNSRNSLLQQTILGEPVVNGSSWRLTSNNSPTWTGNTPHKGWYLDLYNTESGNTNNYGEKQVSTPILSNKRLIFTTLVPTTSGPCTSGGYSWLMELNPENGGRLIYSPFDVNGNGTFTSDDYLTVGNNKGVAAGSKIDGIAGTPSIIKNPSNKSENKYFSTSDGSLKKVIENPGQASGRLSWREIIQN